MHFNITVNFELLDIKVMLDKNILNLKSKYSLLYRRNVVLQLLASYFLKLDDKRG